MAEGGQLPHEKEEILKRLDENLECSICFEQYQDPRVLNCQHSFCAKCLKKLVGDSDIIRCPLCNNKSVKPVEGIDGLKSNFFIKSLIEDVIRKKTELQKELKPKRKCESCDEGNDAISHCDNCHCDLCDNCVDNHVKMRALKDHKVTPLPTEEELWEEEKGMSDAIIESITHDIHEQEAWLNEKITLLTNKIGEIENKRDTEKNKLRESHREFLVKIDEYVQQLSTKINNSAAERLGDMHQQLTGYEQQLVTYKTLKQQSWMISNIQIHKRVKRCQELMQQVSDFQQMSQAVVYRGGKVYVVTPEFVDGGDDPLQVMSGLVRCLGYLKPIPSRFDRKVKIIQELNIAADMKYRIFEGMHDALDHIANYPTTRDSLVAVSGWMRDHMKKKYPQQQWTVIVGYVRGYAWNIPSNSGLEVEIDNMMFTLFKKT